MRAGQASPDPTPTPTEVLTAQSAPTSGTPLRGSRAGSVRQGVRSDDEHAPFRLQCNTGHANGAPAMRAARPEVTHLRHSPAVPWLGYNDVAPERREQQIARPWGFGDDDHHLYRRCGGGTDHRFG